MAPRTPGKGIYTLAEMRGRRGDISMVFGKDGKTIEQVAQEVLRGYLIRCHETISKQYPEVANMDPVNAADFLLHLRDTKRIDIQLYNKSPTSIGCRITDSQSEQGDTG